MTLFKNRKIRNAWDNESQKFWFSTVDICAAIRDTDYATGRNYWKWLKRKLYLQGHPLAAAFKQLKFEALDGKLRYTDVMDAEEILQLIQIFPSPKAEAFRQWIAGLTEEGAAVVARVEEAFNKAKDEVKQRVGRFIQTMCRHKIDITVDLPVGLMDEFVRKADGTCRGLVAA